MKLPFHLLSILFLSLCILACSGSKSYYKKGQKLEESGLNLEAANFYIESVKRKSSNEDAIIALKKLGQKVLDDKYGTFYKYYSDDRYRDAVYAYLDAEEFKNKVTSVGVQLNAAPYYRDYYEEVRDMYITALYQEAQVKLDDEKFLDAENALNEIKRLDPTYKNVDALSAFAFVEPKYRKALRAYDASEFRTAYFLFAEINKRLPEGYKESKDYQALSLESASYSIALFPTENAFKNQILAEGISGSIISSIKALDDPFLKLIDRTSQSELAQEQYRNLSIGMGQQVYVEQTQYSGTNAILVSKIIDAKVSPGRLVKNSRTGWLGKEVRYVDPKTGAKSTRIVYSKAYYYEYEQENKVSCTFQYQLISTATGEILVSDIQKVEKTDEINYATFNGDARLLVPGYWKNQYKNDPSDRRYDSYSYRRDLQQKLEGRRNIKTPEELKILVFNQIGQQVAAQVGAFNPEEK